MKRSFPGGQLDNIHSSQVELILILFCIFLKIFSRIFQRIFLSIVGCLSHIRRGPVNAVISFIIFKIMFTCIISCPSHAGHLRKLLWILSSRTVACQLHNLFFTLALPLLGEISGSKCYFHTLRPCCSLSLCPHLV